MEIAFGLPSDSLNRASDLMWEAFGEKLHRPLGGAERAKRFLVGIADPTTLVVARDGGDLLGAMVLTDSEHRSQADEWAVARDVYGLLAAVPRLILVAPLDTKPPAGCLYVDWIAVAPEARGRGVGSKLLAFAEDVAAQRDLPALALDVVDSNPRAQALYARLGFEVESTRSVWPLSWLYQITSYTRMIKKLPAVV